MSRAMWSRLLALWCWAELTWTLLTFTASIEQIVTGFVVSVAVALACAPLGSVAGPWALLRPRRIVPILVLAGAVAWRVVAANIALSRLIWSGRPPHSGMLVVPTAARSDAEVAATGLLTSLIVNAQLVDVDRHRCQMQYHAVTVESLDADRNRATINGPIEDRVIGVVRR
ncbi:MAG TPA: Na+/H+ antiporter subunit E [Micromonosporaceae bacterium]